MTVQETKRKKEIVIKNVIKLLDEEDVGKVLIFLDGLSIINNKHYFDMMYGFSSSRCYKNIIKDNYCRMALTSSSLGWLFFLNDKDFLSEYEKTLADDKYDFKLKCETDFTFKIAMKYVRRNFIKNA